MAALFQSERREADVARGARVVRDKRCSEGNSACAFGIASRQGIALLPDVQREIVDPEVLLFLRLDYDDERFGRRADPKGPLQFHWVQLPRQGRHVATHGTRRELEDLVEE